MIARALVIADPWIGYILSGEKTWEMRSRSTNVREWFGLIRKGTGVVCGVARLVDVGRPQSPQEMIAAYDRHRIPVEMIRSGKVARWNIPWVVADARALPRPVRYRHRPGAVTWVSLDPEVSVEIESQVDSVSSPMAAGVDLPSTAPKAEPEWNAMRATPHPAVRLGAVELTEGNIRNNHFYLRRFFDRFPGDAVGGSNKGQLATKQVTVDWGDATPAVTDIDGQKMLFRARGWVGRFFAKNDAAPGDSVVVEELGPYRYRVQLEKLAGGVKSVR